ncbi:MAG: YIP1 family protein [candidate division Zixibacteria bacterium]|nr:YIP1 family protein [candidate division Zixibacteria bacterium]
MELKQGVEPTGSSAESGGPTTNSIWSIMLGVFTAPARALAAYNQKPTIWVPLIVFVVLVTVFSGAYAPYQNKASLELMRQSTTLTPEMLQSIEQQSANVSFVRSALTGAAMAVIVTVIMGLLAWMAGTFFFGGTTTFKKIWGVTILGGLIGSVGKLLMLPLVIAKNSVAVSLGPAALYPSKDMTSILFMILMYLDLFTIWSVVVSGIGYAAVFDFPRGKGITISVIVTLISMVVGLGLGMFGMSMAGLDVHFL